VAVLFEQFTYTQSDYYCIAERIRHDVLNLTIRGRTRFAVASRYGRVIVYYEYYYECCVRDKMWSPCIYSAVSNVHRSSIHCGLCDGFVTTSGTATYSIIIIYCCCYLEIHDLVTVSESRCCRVDTWLGP